MTVYIPCYFNSIIERENNFYKNIQQYLNLGYSIIVYWMNPQEFIIKNSKVKIIEGSPVNASVARNKLLDIFYNSKEDYAIFSDDDTFLKVCIKERYDCISYTNDFDKELLDTEKISSSFMQIKNFKKYYNLEPLFDENLEANQDLDFGINLNKIGIKTYRKSTENILIYKGKSSMFSSNMNKLNRKHKSLEYIETKWQIQF